MREIPNNKKIIRVISIAAAAAMLVSCGNYKPPYERGYDEGYEAGYVAAGGDAAQAAAAAAETPADSSQTEAENDSGEETVKHERSPLTSIMSAKTDEESEKDDESNEASSETADEDDSDAEAQADEGSNEEQDGAADEAEAASDDEESSEVLGEGSEPSEESGGGGSAGIPGGRVISAEAVNDALFAHPEVIAGLRDLYPDTAVFGEYVGDSETNLLHRVDGPHFAELSTETLVVFDGSKSLDDILNEGFFTKCSCCE